MRRWRVAALILAVLAFALAGLGPETWLPKSVPFQVGSAAFFWLGVVCMLAAVWGRAGA